MVLVCLLSACSEPPTTAAECIFDTDLSLLERLKESDQLKPASTQELAVYPNSRSGWTFKAETKNNHPIKVQYWSCTHLGLIAELELTSADHAPDDEIKLSLLNLAELVLTPDLAKIVASELNNLPRPTQEGSRLSLKNSSFDDFYVLLTRLGTTVRIEIGWYQA